MSDDLKGMLDSALAEVQRRADAEQTAKRKRDEEIVASGERLKERVMPRLLAAQTAWGDRLKLTIRDNSTKYSTGLHGNTTYPNIEISASAKGHASYTFLTHSPGYASIQELSGGNRMQAYQFKVTTIDDLTDEKIDEILKSLLNEAVGLTAKR